MRRQNEGKHGLSVAGSISGGAVCGENTLEGAIDRKIKKKVLARPYPTVVECDGYGFTKRGAWRTEFFFSQAFVEASKALSERCTHFQNQPYHPSSCRRLHACPEGRRDILPRDAPPRSNTSEKVMQHGYHGSSQDNNRLRHSHRSRQHVAESDRIVESRGV